MDSVAEEEAIAAGLSPQNSSDDSDESDDGRSDLSMSHYDSRIERLVELELRPARGSRHVSDLPRAREAQAPDLWILSRARRR